ncbi:MAG TPA: hypothetical protein VF278_25175 [Pirellulales bacterium]
MTTNRIANLNRVLNMSDSREVAAPEGTNLSFAPSPPIMVGDRVRIIYGALEGVEGTVSARLRGGRLTVAASLVQPDVSIEIDERMVEPVG